MKRTLCFFLPTKLQTFYLLLKALGDFKSASQAALGCGMVRRVLQRAVLRSSCPCRVRSEFHKPLHPVGRLAPSLPDLMSLSFQAPCLVELTQWLV